MITDEAFEHHAAIAKEHGLNTIWSIYEVRDFALVPFPNAVRLRHETNSFWRDFDDKEDESIIEITTLPKNATWLDLWKAANELINKSGDLHHRFIEGFDEMDDGTLVLLTGS